MIVTVPLIPLFMGVVASSTKARTARRLTVLQRLAGQFLDSVTGSPRSDFRRGVIAGTSRRVASDGLRRETLGTLRIAFLSSLILELLASLSVAVVAVAVGLRLVNGGLDLFTGLCVLVLAPEAYQPLRVLAAQFHASADGVAAADQVFEVLETPRPDKRSCTASPDPSAQRLQIHQATVRYRASPSRRSAGSTSAPIQARSSPWSEQVGPASQPCSRFARAHCARVRRVTVGDQDLSALDPALCGHGWPGYLSGHTSSRARWATTSPWAGRTRHGVRSTRRGGVRRADRPGQPTAGGPRHCSR